MLTFADLMMALDEQWEDPQSYYASSCREHECVYQITCPSNSCWDISVWSKVVGWLTDIAYHRSTHTTIKGKRREIKIKVHALHKLQNHHANVTAIFYFLYTVSQNQAWFPVDCANNLTHWQIGIIRCCGDIYKLARDQVQTDMGSAAFRHS